MKVILALILTTVFLSGTENTLDKLRTLQNFDGSFGKSEGLKFQTTATVISAFLSRNQAVKYQETISAGIDYISKESALISNRNVTIMHLMALKVLSEYYTLKPKDEILEICLGIKRKIYADFSNGKWDLEGKPDLYCHFLSLALFACDSSKAIKIDKESMKALGLAAANRLRMDESSAVFFRMHSAFWNLSRKIDADKINFGSVDGDLVKRLDSSSPRKRKDALDEVKSLSVQGRIVLMETLKICRSFELKQVSADIAEEITLEEIASSDCRSFQINSSKMLMLSYVHHKDSKMRVLWWRKCEKVFNEFGKIENVLKLDALDFEKYDHRLRVIANLINAYNAPLEALSSFRKLGGTRNPNKQETENISAAEAIDPVLTTVEEFAEEGLDLVE